ncbi:MAG: hypothetical protein ABIR83_07365 [Nakamurella sp.]
MRAWAAISAAAVLVALPSAVDRTAGSVGQSDTTAPVAGAIDATQLSGTSLGIMLWLAVAVIAVVVSFVVLRHSRAQLDAIPVEGTGARSAPALRSVSGTSGR